MAVHAVGSSITIGGTLIAELKSITPPTFTNETIETTTLDSVGGYRTFIAGFKDGGECKIDGFLSLDIGQETIRTAFDTQALQTFVVTFPATLGTRTYTFSGIVTSWETPIEFEDAIPFTATIKVSGALVVGTSESAALTALTIVGAGGTMSPAFASNVTSYTLTGATSANAVITPTLTGMTGSIYENDAFAPTLGTQGKFASGQAITVPMTIGSKKIELIYNQAGKTPKIITIVLIKVS